VENSGQILHFCTTPVEITGIWWYTFDGRRELN